MPIRGGQENPSPLRKNCPFMVAPSALRTAEGPTFGRNPSHARARAFVGVRFLPLNSIADPGVAVKIRESGAGNSLQTPFSQRGAVKWQAARFCTSHLISFFSLFFFFASSFHSRNEARNNDLAVVWTRNEGKLTFH